MPFSRLRFASFAAVATLAACSSAPTSPEATSTSSQRIIHGKVSDSSQDSVVLIEQVTMGFGCSGTLLAPNLVLTARHCVSALQSEGVSCDAKGDPGPSSGIGADFVPGTIFIYTGNTRPATFGANPAAKGKQIIHDGATNLCNHDLALILLDNPIDGAKISPVRLDSPPVKADTVTAVGWGISETAEEPPQRLQRNGIPIVAIGPNATGTLPTPPNNFQVGEAFCQGDSGGPGFAESTGAVIGVVSYGGNGSGDTSTPWGNCIDKGNGVFNMYTEVAPFKDLIVNAYQLAGQDPWVEGGPNPLLAPFGNDCTADGDCQSNICYTDPKSMGQTCSSDCTSSDCPDGFDCKSDDTAGTQICKPHVATAATNNSTTTKASCTASPTSDGSSSLAWTALVGFAIFGARRRRALAAPARIRVRASRR